MSEQKQQPVQGKQSLPVEQNAEVPWWRNDPWLGAHLYWENRSKHPELVEQHEGKCVAWYPDGSGIRGSHEDMHTLWRQIEEAGEDPQWYLFEYINTQPQV